MKNWKIFYKLFFSHTAIGLITVLGLSFIFYTILQDSLIQRTIDQLSSINILKKNQIEMHFSRTENKLTFLFESQKFKNAYRYIQSPDMNLYSEDYASFIREASGVKEHYDYEKLIIYNKDLEQLFPASEGSSRKDSILKRHLSGISDTSSQKFYAFDVSNQYTDTSTTLMYMLPLVIGDNSLAGYLVIIENIERIQEILYERTGMGSTGESYLVGSDLYMRSFSRFFPDSFPLSIKVQTKASVNALKNAQDDYEIKDYRGVDVLSVYRPIQFHGIHWAIISEMDVSEAMMPINKLKSNFIFIAFTIMVLVLLITSSISNAISKPILFFKDWIIELSKGIIPEKKELKIMSQDEIGQISVAIQQLTEGLRRTTEFANQTGSGNFTAPFTSLSEQDALGIALINMRDKLKMLTEREVRLVRERAAALMEGQEKERQRIIRELHDGVGQLLTVINLRLEAWETDLELKNEIKALVKETIAEVRRISYNVMPSALVDFGLEAALKGLLENIKKYSGLAYEFNYVKETEEVLSFEVRTAVFRIVQEGLNNIIKHSGATKVDLFLLKNEGEIYFVLKDNGKGFQLNEVENKGGFGLRSMRERTKLLNGEIEVQSSEGKGTIIEVHIPDKEKHE